MNAKQLVLDFYKSGFLLEIDRINQYLHSDVVLEWNSSKGFLKLDKNGIIEISNNLIKSYASSRIEISHILQENNLVSVRYSHYVSTLENPSDDILLAHFIVVWEIKEDKLLHGYQMSQLT